MLRVRYTITVGNTVYTLDKHTRLIDLRVQSGLMTPVNTCGLVFGVATDLALAPADVVKVELGYDTDLALVFSGAVESVDWGITQVTVRAASSWQALVTARLNLVYDKPKAGDIVSDIAAKLKLSTAKVDNGLAFSAYAVGEHQTAYEHLRRLAQQSGCDLYADTQDKLVFAPYRAATTHPFQYGATIMSLRLDAPSLPVSGVDVYGESPASHGQGAEAAAWLTKKDVKGTAGDTAGIVVRLSDPTARTQAAAQTIAKAALASRTATRRGVLSVVGAAGVKLGDAVQVSKMPVPTQNETFKVTGVTHRLNATSGFLTTIAVQQET